MAGLLDASIGAADEGRVLAETGVVGIRAAAKVGGRDTCTGASWWRILITVCGTCNCVATDVQGMFWRATRLKAEAEAAARATVTRAKRIMKVRRVKVNEGVQQQRAFCVRRRKLKGELEMGAEFIEFWGTAWNSRACS